MTRVGGPKGPGGPKGAVGGGSKVGGGASSKFSVGGAGSGSTSSGALQASFLSDVRLLAEAVTAGRISEDVAFERLVQTAIARRVAPAGAGNTTLIRSVTDIVRDDPYLASEIRKLLADAAKPKGSGK